MRYRKWHGNTAARLRFHKALNKQRILADPVLREQRRRLRRASEHARQKRRSAERRAEGRPVWRTMDKVLRAAKRRRELFAKADRAAVFTMRRLTKQSARSLCVSQARIRTPSGKRGKSGVLLKELVARRIRWSRHPAKRKIIRKCRSIRASYDTTLKVIHRMLKLQGYRCAICRTDIFLFCRPWASIDHDHATGKIRHILCSRCNIMVGFIENNIQLVTPALDYIKSFQETA